MRLREHPGVRGKIDAYPFDPRKLKIKSGYNVRDLDSADERPFLDELKASIREHGVEEPLRVKLEDKTAYVVRGHRRHKAVMELIGEGFPIESVLVIQVPASLNDADLNLDLIISNENRKDLNQLQVAEIIRRQHIVYGWDVDKIAKSICKTVHTVNNYLKMCAMPEAAKQDVREGKVSATLAAKLSKEEPELYKEIVNDAAAEKKRLGKKARATPKGIRKQIERHKPKPQAFDGAVLLLDNEADAATTTNDTLPPIHEPAASVELPPASVPELTVAAATARAAKVDLHQATLDKVAEHNGWTPDEPAAVPYGTAFHFTTQQGVKDLVATLAPFSQIVSELALDEYGDDDLISVPLKHLKQAAAMHAKATGGADV